MIELRHLRYFVAVAEAGSFTLAALRLHTVQPSISRQIKDLENYLGTTLFERSTRKLSLTPAGSVFLDEAKLVLFQMDRAVIRTRQTAQIKYGALILGFLFGVEVKLMAGVMTALNSGSTSVALTMHNMSSPELIRALHNHEIDAAFIRPSDDCTGLVLRSVYHESLVAAVPSQHPFASLESVTVQQMAKEKFITVADQHSPILHALVDNYFKAANTQISSAFEAENLMMALSLISSMGGVALLPEYTQQLYPTGVVSVPLRGHVPTIELALAYHPDNHNSALEALLTSF